jgi:4-carboxymuconolactone decarboxylase
MKRWRCSVKEPLMTDRMPPIPPELWNEAQRAQAQEMLAGPRKAIVAPFVPLLRSPELAGHVQRLGAYLRYRSAIGTRLTELAILITAKHYEQPVEWAIHAPVAAQEGIEVAVIDAIQRGERPRFANADEALVYNYCSSLLAQRGQVDDALWQRMIDQFGEQSVVDLTAAVGYYGLLALVMNAARTQL